MPTKLNHAGNQQNYVPAGHGDASGEYGDNDTGSNIHIQFKKFEKPKEKHVYIKKGGKWYLTPNTDENIERFFNTESIFDEDLKELPLNSTTEEYESVASIADYIQSYSPEDRAEIAREINNGEISIKCK